MGTFCLGHHLDSGHCIIMLKDEYVCSMFKCIKFAKTAKHQQSQKYIMVSCLRFLNNFFITSQNLVYTEPETTVLK